MSKKFIFLIRSSSSNEFFTSLCKLFKLNHAQELVFVLALQNSNHSELQTLAHNHIQKRLPEFIQTIIESGGMLIKIIFHFKNFLFKIMV
jgi:hypothetical protein